MVPPPPLQLQPSVVLFFNKTCIQPPPLLIPYFFPSHSIVGSSALPSSGHLIRRLSKKKILATKKRAIIKPGKGQIGGCRLENVGASRGTRGADDQSQFQSKAGSTRFHFRSHNYRAQSPLHAHVVSNLYFSPKKNHTIPTLASFYFEA